jgi:inner membrane protein
MPSPIGHALAGLAVAWTFEPLVESKPPDAPPLFGRLTLACVAAATLPDLDLLHDPLHRTVTHSVGCMLLIIIMVAAVTGWVTGRMMWRFALVVGAAQASHILLDWLGVDRFDPRGLQALWPFSRDWFISGWDLFLPTERRDPWSMRAIGINVRAATRELIVLGTIALGVWLLRRRRRSPVPSSDPDGRRRPSAAAGDRGDTLDRQGRRASRSESPGRYRAR